MKAPKFRDFITEAKKEKYKLLVITDEPEKAKTFHTADRLREEAEKLGWDYYLYKLNLLKKNRYLFFHKFYLKK